jgi:hypothetical protein
MNPFDEERRQKWRDRFEEANVWFWCFITCFLGLWFFGLVAPFCQGKNS